MLEASRRLPGLTRPLWILAQKQTSGRGRRGRAWVDPAGNFAATLVMRLADPPARLALRSFTAALALRDALTELTGLDTAFALKWLWSAPMDVIDYFVTYLQAKGPDSEAYAAAYTKWQTADTEDQMMEAAREMQLLYAERLPIIPILTPNTVWVNHKRVVGWQPHQANLYPWYHDVWIQNGE